MSNSIRTYLEAISAIPANTSMYPIQTMRYPQIIQAVPPSMRENRVALFRIVSEVEKGLESEDPCSHQSDLPSVHQGAGECQGRDEVEVALR